MMITEVFQRLHRAKECNSSTPKLFKKYIEKQTRHLHGDIVKHCHDIFLPLVSPQYIFSLIVSHIRDRRIVPTDSPVIFKNLVGSHVGVIPKIIIILKTAVAGEM